MYSEELDYVSHVGHRHEIGDYTNYNHVISQESDFGILKEDFSGSQFKKIISLKKSVFVRTSNYQWIKNFYLPNLDCAEWTGEMVLFQSDDSNPSFIHFNNDTFKLETNSNILFKNTNGRWKAVKAPYISRKFYLSTFSLFLKFLKKYGTGIFLY